MNINSSWHPHVYGGPCLPNSTPPLEKEGRELLKKRDQFIAGRINQTLKKGATGILFIGMLHDITSRLQGDIDIVYPLNNEGGARKPVERTAVHPLQKKAYTKGR